MHQTPTDWQTLSVSPRRLLIGRSTLTGPVSTRCTCACGATAAPGWSASTQKRTSLTRKTTCTRISCTPEGGPTGRTSRFGKSQHFILSLLLTIKYFTERHFKSSWFFFLFQNDSFHPQIPFSKFFLTHRGRIHDSQHHILLDKVKPLTRHQTHEATSGLIMTECVCVCRWTPLASLWETKLTVRFSWRSISSASAKITHTRRSLPTRATRGIPRFNTRDSQMDCYRTVAALSS